DSAGDGRMDRPDVLIVIVCPQRIRHVIVLGLRRGEECSAGFPDVYDRVAVAGLDPPEAGGPVPGGYFPACLGISCRLLTDGNRSKRPRVWVGARHAPRVVVHAQEVDRL